MDIDISDILADVSRPQPHRPQQPFSSSSSGPPTPYLPDTSTYTDHQLLTRAWTAERCTVELLPYPAQLMARVMERIAAQIGRIEELAGGGGGDVGGGGAQQGANVNLVLSILQTDLSRTQFLVRSLLRARLGKVTRFAGHYLYLVDADDTQRQQREDDDLDMQEGAAATRANGLLSAAEAQFLRHQQGILKNFYDGSFLTGFPPKMRRLDDGGTGEGGMLEGPNGDGVALVRCLVEQGWRNSEDVGVEGSGVVNEVGMRRGDVSVVRWADVRKGVLVDKALEVL